LAENDPKCALALAFLQGNMGEFQMYDVKLLIGGKEQAARGGATFERRNPVSGDVYRRRRPSTDARWPRWCAQAAFAAWSTQGPGAPPELNKAADLLARGPRSSLPPYAMKLHRRLGAFQRALRRLDAAPGRLDDHAGFG
jgi:hypothetical protein